MKPEQFNQAIDGFIATYLTKIPDEKKDTVEYILQLNREAILEVLTSLNQADFGLGELEDICDSLSDNNCRIDSDILDAAGLPDLNKEIAEYRQQIKWDLLINELREVVASSDTFNPNQIKNLNKELYDALKAALKRELPGNEEFDWELLRTKLPEDLETQFESKRIANGERRRVIDESTKVQIEKLGLNDVIAGLSGDPKKLAYYLDIAGFDLSEKDKTRIIHVTFKGLQTNEKKLDRLMETCEPTLPELEILSDVPTNTEENYITLKVKVPEGAESLLVRGPWSRDIKIKGNRVVEFDVILEPGVLNEILLLPYNENIKEEDKKIEGDDKTKRKGLRSELTIIEITQTGEKVDEDALAELLIALGKKTLEEIQKDPGKKELFVKCLEESIIRQFAGDFATGEKYIKQLIEKCGKIGSTDVINMLKAVLRLFKKIDEKQYPFIQTGEDLLFFQKYCVYKINKMRAAGLRGGILANEPGLGKTLTALAAFFEDELLVISPKSAASTWIEQEAKFFNNPFLLNLSSYNGNKKRKQILGTRKHTGVLANIEFLRTKLKGGKGKLSKFHQAKMDLLNQSLFEDRKKVTTIDEGHFLKNDTSQQTQGVSLLKHDFLCLLTASPYRNSFALCKLMHRLMPEDEHFKSANAFAKAFPSNDPQALKTLHLMTQPYVIRFLKSEVMSTYDGNTPLDEQPLSLPAKKYIDPHRSGWGLFTLTPGQEDALVDLFKNWNEWCKKYDRYMPKDKDVRNPDNRLIKEHALRQAINDPAFINSTEESPKHKEVMRILEHELGQGKKVLIFCRYKNQVKKYAELIEKMKGNYGYALFTGDKSDEGTKKDDNGKEIKYLVDKFDNYCFENGKPIVAKKGQPSKNMLAIDYERLAFQNDPNVQVCIATYAAGSQSVTFTAADVMIKEGAPNDATEDYQSEDRIHRVDNERRKKEVTYYHLIGRYSEEFLEAMQNDFVENESETEDGPSRPVSVYEKWLMQGSYDEVHYRKLKAQRTTFDLLNNGIAVDPDLMEEEEKFDF